MVEKKEAKTTTNVATPLTSASPLVPAKKAAKKVAKKAAALEDDFVDDVTSSSVDDSNDSQDNNKSILAPIVLPKGNVPSEDEKKPKEKASAIFAAEQVISDDSDSARDLYAQSRFGAMLDDGKLQLSLIEALYLLEKGRLIVKDLRGRPYDFQKFIKRAKSIEPNFWVRYSVFKDMRNRGYIVKTALKFGADFRVYDRGIKPGEDHARWVLYPIHEGTTLTWHEFAAKARVAHSTKKRLLIGIVDDEADVTYYEIRWMRP